MQKNLFFPDGIGFHSYAAVGGCEEGRGPVGRGFDLIDDTDRFGAGTWEKAESEICRLSLNLALKKGKIDAGQISILAAGDLENQCVASAYGLAPFNIPYLGLYGACSTLTEGLIAVSCHLAAAGGDEGLFGAVVTSSHNAAAERQFRTPLEYGAQRTPSAQWTATAGGAFLLRPSHGKARITAVMPGRIRDGEVTDGANMGAAMAPAAADSILSYFEKCGENPEDYDLILTGDLGRVGSDLLREILDEKYAGKKHALSDRHDDCGLNLYDFDLQDVHAGGSGCGCSAAVLAAKFLPAVERGEIRRMLLLSTGALMSPSSIQQKLPILGIAPLVRIEYRA